MYTVYIYVTSHIQRRTRLVATDKKITVKIIHMQFLLESPEESVDQLRVLSPLRDAGPPLVDIKSCCFF